MSHTSPAFITVALPGLVCTNVFVSLNAAGIFSVCVNRVFKISKMNVILIMQVNTFRGAF